MLQWSMWGSYEILEWRNKCPNRVSNLPCWKSASNIWATMRGPRGLSHMPKFHVAPREWQMMEPKLRHFASKSWSLPPNTMSQDIKGGIFILPLWILHVQTSYRSWQDQFATHQSTLDSIHHSMRPRNSQAPQTRHKKGGRKRWASTVKGCLYIQEQNLGWGDRWPLFSAVLQFWVTGCHLFDIVIKVTNSNLWGGK